MTTSKRIGVGQLAIWTSCTIVIILCLLQPAEVKAQWTTPDASQNINNTNTGNVGIGTTTPTAPLEVKKSQSAGTTLIVDNPFTTSSNGAFSGFFLKQAGVNRLLISSVNDNHGSITPGTAQFWNFANGPIVFANNNAETMRLTATGNLGIGTTNPGARLVTFGNFLAGNITTHTQLYSTYDSQSNVIMELGYGTPTSNITPLTSLVLSKNLTNPNQGLGVISFANSNIANGNEKRLTSISTWTDGALNSGALAIATTQTGTINERMRITSGGNVGIGTATPSLRFEVVGPGTWVAKFRRTDNTNGGIMIDSPAGFNPNLGLATNGAVKWYINSNASNSDKLQFWESTGTIARFTFTQGGTFGIGTENPNTGYKLDVVGSINTNSGLCFNGDCKTAWSQVGGNSQWASGGSGSINYGGGFVGIGTLTPSTKLDVVGTVDADAFSVNGVAVVSSQWATTGSTINYATGNVGIATPSPTEKLHVTGNVKIVGSIDVTGNIKAKYQDVAEWVESSQPLSAGTVVVLDSSKSNQVVASTQSYDSGVAGVISAQPGLELGERGEGRVLVATTGRVKVKVDASSGPIKIGDLLVTSDKEGFAMKSLPIDIGGARIHRPGTLIGKALEPLATGTGEILVLLSLQ